VNIDSSLIFSYRENLRFGEIDDGREFFKAESSLQESRSPFLTITTISATWGTVAFSKHRLKGKEHITPPE
jgi:hypothetical protein